MSDHTASAPENEAEFEAYLQESLSGLDPSDPAALTPEVISAHLYRKCVGPAPEDGTANVQGTFKMILNEEVMAGFAEGNLGIVRETHFEPSFTGLLAAGAQQWNGPSIGTLNAVGYTEGVTFYAVNHSPFNVILKDRLVICFFKGSLIHWKKNCIGVFVGIPIESGKYTFGSGTFTN